MKPEPPISSASCRAWASRCGRRGVSISSATSRQSSPAGFFAAIHALKEQLEINVELACPSDFIPALPAWRERSLFIARHGRLDFYHYDFYSQALAKIERGHDRDLRDVRRMLEAGLVRPDTLGEGFEQIRPALLRYPAIDPAAFVRKVAVFTAP